MKTTNRKSKQLLPFISNKDLKSHVRLVLEKVERAEEKNDIFSNAVDPFSAMFDVLRKGFTAKDWLEIENVRQIQKTMQNAIGDMHQNIIGSMPGWVNMESGHVIDVKNDQKKIIAEIKNKWNTTKGNHRPNIYDDLKSQLAGEFPGYKGYYVEVIPKNKARYDKPFTPSDNRTHRQRPVNENIRVIDGYSFYALASGHNNALKQLFSVLPKVISGILGVKIEKGKHQNKLLEIFNKTY